MNYCAIVVYRIFQDRVYQGDSHRVVGPFDSYEATKAWCERNRSELWRETIICPVEMPNTEEPREEQW